MAHSALLVLEDGTVFKGVSIGADGCTVGEVVFNTSMTGYQEILTDPSYTKQIVTLTYPHIGNYGINKEDQESSKIHLQALVIRNYTMIESNFRSEESLSDYLTRHNVLGIANIDTRKLTRILRTKGSMSGCIMAGESLNEQEALEKAKSFAGLKGMDLAKEVTTPQAYEWKIGTWSLGKGFSNPKSDELKYNVVAYDFGVKQNPEPCDYAIKAIQEIVQKGIPTFGICLGHQLLGLASGAKTIKMKFGHHGANHPVKDLSTNRVMITSQNHGFAVDPDTLPENLKVTHVSLFDGSVQGIERTDRPAFSFQGHPEASPGPHDVTPLFEHFIDLIKAYKESK